ncbi:60S ribosomal protein L11 [Pyrenophora tritici-repentis]|nr:60S ribosomal protein L11 [Pyrenophora tritici-repentis]KAI0619013.1 60S ribosomal protein L11 [Pyrenophora tritici-repentis]
MLATGAPSVHWLRRFRQLIECRRCTSFTPKLSIARLLTAAVDTVSEVPLDAVHITVRGSKVDEILERSLKVEEYELRNHNFSESSNFDFGIIVW